MGYQMEKRLIEKHKLLMPLKKSMPDEVYQKLKDLKPIIMGGAIRAVFTNTKEILTLTPLNILNTNTANKHL